MKRGNARGAIRQNLCVDRREVVKLVSRGESLNFLDYKYRYDRDRLDRSHRYSRQTALY